MIEFNVRDQNKLWPHLQPEGYTATEKKKKEKIYAIIHYCVTAIHQNYHQLLILISALFVGIN